MIECSFLLPSAKLDRSLVTWLEDLLLVRYNGFAGPEATRGAWGGPYGVCREANTRYIVAVLQDQVPDFRAFLGRLANLLGEECIYLSIGGKVALVPPTKSEVL